MSPCCAGETEFGQACRTDPRSTSKGASGVLTLGGDGGHITRARSWLAGFFESVASSDEEPPSEKPARKMCFASISGYRLELAQHS